MTKTQRMAEAGKLRTYKEANGTWSAYCGAGYVTGGYRTEGEAVSGHMAAIALTPQVKPAFSVR